MAKPFKNYALVRSPYLWGREYRVLGVTLVKGRQVYGRWVDDDASTHIRESEVVHYVNDLAEARAAVDRIKRAAEQHAPLVEAAREALNAAEQARRVAIKAAAVKREP